MNIEELKPCPFCGDKPKVDSLSGDNENWMIWCKCGMARSEMGINGDSLSELKIKWNTRITNGLYTKEKVEKLKQIIIDKREELRTQLRELPSNDGDSETIRKKQMLTHSILVLKVTLDKIESAPSPLGDKK